MILQIRNMVSDRCILMVQNEIIKQGLHYKRVELGNADIKESIPREKWQMIDIALKDIGLELIDNKTSSLVEKIKSIICQLISHLDGSQEPDYCIDIKKKVNYDYAYLSNLFSRTQGITIEKFIITKKIERVKEMLVYSKMKMSDIAFKLHYSSVSHLSNQFKKVTGSTLSHFRQLRKARYQNF